MQLAWEATLDDGTTVKQSDGNLYADLPLSEVRKLRVILEGFPVDINVPIGCEPVYGIIHEQTAKERTVVYDTCVVAGWRDMLPSSVDQITNRTAIMYLYSDGSSELSQRDFTKEDVDITRIE